MGTETKTLSKEALAVIDNYLSLPELGVPCPYYININNTKGLAVEVGKGTPEEIVEEAKELAHKARVSLDAKNALAFLAEHHLGIDCSGLAYHILDAESQARGEGKLKKHIGLSFIKKWRAATNINVQKFVENSKVVSPKDVRPGDFLPHTNKYGRDHMWLIHAVDLPNIYYTESSQDHGVNQDQLNINNLDKEIRRFNWF